MYDRPLSPAELASGGRAPGDSGVRFWFDAATARYVEQPPSEPTYLSYGGDWGDNPNDGNFEANGILPADRRLGGKAVEVKHIYPAINVAPGADIRSGDVTITNENLFTNVDEYAGHWTLCSRRQAGAARDADRRADGHPAAVQPEAVTGERGARRVSAISRAVRVREGWTVSAGALIGRGS